MTNNRTAPTSKPQTEQRITNLTESPSFSYQIFVQEWKPKEHSEKICVEVYLLADALELQILKFQSFSQKGNFDPKIYSKTCEGAQGALLRAQLYPVSSRKFKLYAGRRRTASIGAREVQSNTNDQTLNIEQRLHGESTNTCLVASRRHLIQINPMIFQLECFMALKELRLDRNQLSSLPETIGVLVNLRQLILDNNLLEELPESIGNLKRLKRLSVEGNKLRRIPKSIGHLQRLRELNLSENQIKSIPQSLGNLCNLELLDLERNKIRAVPIEIGLLKQLYHLKLYECPLDLTPPPPTKRRGPRSLKDILLGRFLNEPSLAGQLVLGIRAELARAQKCSFCGKLFTGQAVERIAIAERQVDTSMVPFLYTMCQNHWKCPKTRLKAMFAHDPPS